MPVLARAVVHAVARGRDNELYVLMADLLELDAHLEPLLQALRVERIPLLEIDYKYAGVERKLWICGQQQEVYAPKSPWRRQRSRA